MWSKDDAKCSNSMAFESAANCSNIIVENNDKCLVIRQGGDLIAVPLNCLDDFFYVVMRTVDIPQITKDEIMRKYRNKLQET